MKAATQDNYGAPNVLQIADVERPSLGDHDLLVQVAASVVTQGDRRSRAADFPGVTWLPGRLMMGVFRPNHRIPGTMFAGRVVAVGPEVCRYSVGDDVFGNVDHGAHAEYLAVSEDGPMARMPSSMSYEEAAAVPYGAETALIILRDLVQVKRGEHVLVIGASGGVGRFAVQLAKHLGAEVTGVSRRRNHDLLRDLGVDEVIDYQTEDFRDNGERYDVVFDTIGATRFDRCRDSMTAEGRYVSLIVTVRLLVQVLTTSLVGGQRALFTVAMGERQEMEDVGLLMEQGVFRPVIDRCFALDRIADAHIHLQSGDPQGAVVVGMGHDVAALAAK